MDVERTKRPTGVMRFASGNNLPLASRSSDMVLNFNNLKILADFPGLSWVKKGLPLFTSVKKRIRNSRNGESKSSSISEAVKSISLLMKNLYKLFMPGQIDLVVKRFNKIHEFL
jgi:hypothetical protein